MVLALNLIFRTVVYIGSMGLSFANEEPEAQRGEVIGPRSHRQSARDLELEHVNSERSWHTNNSLRSCLLSLYHVPAMRCAETVTA